MDGLSLIIIFTFNLHCGALTGVFISRGNTRVSPPLLPLVDCRFSSRHSVARLLLDHLPRLDGDLTLTAVLSPLHVRVEAGHHLQVSPCYPGHALAERLDLSRSDHLQRLVVVDTTQIWDAGLGVAAMALSVLHWLSSCYHTCQQLHVQPREVYLDTEPGHPDTSQWWSPPWPGGRGASSACRWGRTSTALSWSLTACRVKYLESKVRPAVCSNYQSAHSPFNISKSVKSRPTLSIPNMESS